MHIHAIERVADKRHARLMAAGASEKESSHKVAGWLQHLLDTQLRANVHDRAHIRALIDGYTL